MYVFNKELLNRIEEISKEAARRSNGEVSYEEYIALPYHGWIILRFGLDKSAATLDELDEYEAELNDIAGGEFLVDFMGSVYRSAGVEYEGFEEKLVSLADEFAQEPVPTSVHAEGIRRDAEYLLAKAGLPATEKVWEIQPEDDGVILILMDRDIKTTAELEDGKKLIAVGTKAKPCEGLIRAAMFARRTGVSLARLIK